MESQNESRKEESQRRFQIDKLEERIAPSIPPGLQGYEGQPGNQAGGNTGLLGYEGQPGNQGGH
jgi:hypothetical protein